MRPLAEAIHDLRRNELLVGKTVAHSEFLKIWIHRHPGGYDLYVTSTVDASRARAGGPFRNTVGKGLESAAEVLEAVHNLDAIYRVEVRDLLELPMLAREATPELVELIGRQLGRITSSTKTGEFAPDDLPATIVKVDGEGVIELEPDEFEEDVEHLVLTDA